MSQCEQVKEQCIQPNAFPLEQQRTLNMYYLFVTLGFYMTELLLHFHLISVPCAIGKAELYFHLVFVIGHGNSR